MRRGALTLMARTAVALGMEQLQDLPSSTSRKPRNPHRGPGKRQVSEKEADTWRFVKKWELTMKDEWDANESFRHLPKPKKQFGNEACEIVWPYAVLLENVIRVHHFTKSIYVYYPQHSLSDEGGRAAELAKRFAQECLVPITFHNAQCYVEAELLVEYGDTPWIVVNCLDGRHEIVPVAPVEHPASAEAKTELLKQVLAVAEKLGSSVPQPQQLMRQLNERPNQNGFVKVDYQWMGDTPEERQAHTVQWSTAHMGESAYEPRMPNRQERMQTWLSFDGGKTVSPAAAGSAARDQRRAVRARMADPSKQFMAAGSRMQATHARYSGSKGGR